MESTYAEELIDLVMSTKGWSREKAIAWLERRFPGCWRTTARSKVVEMLRPLSERYKYRYLNTGPGEAEPSLTL